MKNTIAAMPTDAKPNAASVLFTLIHHELIDLGLNPDFRSNGAWPCDYNYTIERDRHIYKFGNVSLRVSIIEEGYQLIPLYEQEQNPTNAPQSQVPPNVASQTKDCRKGEYFYILIELKNDPSGFGYTISDFLRDDIPLFTAKSETMDRVRMRDLRGIVCDDIQKFEGCATGKKFQCTEYSRHGVNPFIPLSSGKRKMGEGGNSPESNAPETRTSLSFIGSEELEEDFDKVQNDKPTEPAKLAATLMTILRNTFKCSVPTFHSNWLVPPDYTNQVIFFQYPTIKKPFSISEECDYDTYRMSILCNGSDYFVVFREAPVPSNYVVKKIRSCLVPKLFADDTEEGGMIAISETMKWYNLNQWLKGVIVKFCSKMSDGFSTPSSSSDERSLSSENQSPAADSE